MLVEHVRTYVSPAGEVKITIDRAGWPEVADAVIRMHRARIQQKKAQGDDCFNTLVEIGMCNSNDRWAKRWLERHYAGEELKQVKKLRKIRKKMRQGYCPYNRERFRLEDAYALYDLLVDAGGINP